MRHMRLLIPQPHRPDKAFILHRPPRKVWSHKCRLRDHSFPTLLRSLLPRLDYLEHFLFAYPLHLGQGNAELSGFFIPLIFDGATERLCVGGLGSVEEVLGKGGGGGFGGTGGFDV